MQGRLSERPRSRLQAFPGNTWERELSLAKEVGFDCVEWVLETAPGPENPIWSTEGRSAIRAASDASGVAVSSVCADYFMSSSLGEPESVPIMKELIVAAADVGARRILVPLVEQAALPTEALRESFRHGIRQCLGTAEACGVVLALEMEVPGAEYAAFVHSFRHPLVRACYDTGNSTAQGFDIGTDILPVAPLLDAIHVKDRNVGGTSQPLGTGDANFDGLFAALAAHGFRGDVILQHYFDADPVLDALRSFKFVKQGLARATREVA